MKDDAKNHYRKIRAELAEMLGFKGDPDALPIDQDMRLGVVFGLKLSLDEMRGRLYRGETIDTGEMRTLADTLERYLPKRPDPEPVEWDRDDPHENLMRIVEGWIAADEAEKAEKAAERRAQGLSEPVADLATAQARIDQLEAENARLRGEDDPKLLATPSEIPESEREPKVITPRDIIEPSRLYVGPPPPGPDDPPKRSTAVIDAKPVPTAPTDAEREANRLRVNADRSA